MKMKSILSGLIGVLRCLHVAGSQLRASIKQTNGGNSDRYSERSLHS